MGTSSKSSAPPIIRLAHPLAFAAFLQHIGAPTDRHFQRQRLPVYSSNPDVFVPLRRAWAFFDATAQAEDPMLGWHVGRFVGDHNLNAAFLRKLESAPTLYAALKKLVRMISAEASHLQLGILERQHDILFYTQYSALKDMPGYTSSQAYQLEVYLDLIRHFLGKQWVPEEIGIEYPVVPRVVDEHFHGCRILTNQPVGYIAVARADLHAPPPSRIKDEGQEAPVLTETFDYLETLKALLKAYMADGYPTARKVAPLMDTSVRTLARRLSAFGLTYRDVVDEVRFGAAKELLSDSLLQVGDVARATGFDDPAHFARMFRRIGGSSPRQYRETLLPRGR